MVRFIAGAERTVLLLGVVPAVTRLGFGAVRVAEVCVGLVERATDRADPSGLVSGSFLDPTPPVSVDPLGAPEKYFVEERGSGGVPTAGTVVDGDAGLDAVYDVWGRWGSSPVEDLEDAVEDVFANTPTQRAAREAAKSRHPSARRLES